MGAHSNLADCAPSFWKLPPVVRNLTCMLSGIDRTADGLLDVGPAPFRVEPIECLYATSGVYAPALRVIFYILCLLSLYFRRGQWVSGVCMGIVMSYSSIAAIHAITLASSRKKLIAAQIEMVPVSTRGDVKIPVWPMAWDEDSDAVLAVIGTAFLIVAPMMIWSDTVRQVLQNNDPNNGNFREERKKRKVLVGWFALLLAGLISAWINEAFVDTYSVEQFRFCSAGGQLPDIGSTSSLSLLDRQMQGRSVNDTIWDVFSIPSISQGHLPTCIYPCFGAPGLRQAGDIRALRSESMSPSTSDYRNPRAGWALMVTSMVLIAISFTVMVLFYILWRREYLEYGPDGFVRGEGNQDVWLWLNRGAKGLAISSFLIFVAWIEYTLWPFPYTERFWDIGQWGQVATIILVLTFAAYDEWDKFVRDCELHILHIRQSALVNFLRRR